MNSNTSMLLIIGVIGLAPLPEFFWAKSKGLGRFATTSLLMLLVVRITSLLFAAVKLKSPVLANVFFAVTRFAGGLFTTRNLRQKGAAPMAANLRMG